MKLLLFLAFLSLSHCGYNWGHEGRSLPGGHKTVFVAMFENRSKEVGAEASFTQALMTELERSGFSIVTSEDSAELVLKGTILSVTNSDSGQISGAFYKTDHVNLNAESYDASLFSVFRMNVTVNLKAIRSRDKRAVWHSTLTGGNFYQGAALTQQGVRTSNVLYNQSRRQQTMKLIAKEMMNQAFDQLTENF